MTSAADPILDALARNAPRVAVDGAPGPSLSYGALRGQVLATAAAWSDLPPGPVALLAENGPPWVVAALASLVAGRTLLPLPGFFSDEQLDYALALARPALWLTDDGARALRLRPDSRLLGARAGLLLLAPRAAQPALPGVALVTFTSGSTGRPKGVCLPARSLLTVARSLGATLGARGRGAHLSLLPLAVLLEQVGGMLRTLLAGDRLCVPPASRTGIRDSSAVDGELVLQALDDARAATAILVPGQLQALVEVLASGRRRPPADLRFLGVGGAKTPPGLLARARELGLPACEGYGLTEAASVVSVSMPEAIVQGSVGRALPHVRLAVAADGELHVGGAILCGHLVPGPEGGHFRAATLDPAGLLPTGDLGRVDEEGFLTIHGRRDQLIVTPFGRNVSPEWIEALLVERCPIRQAVVLGSPRAGLDAVVVTDAARDELLASIRRLNESLPDYARVLALLPRRDRFSVARGEWLPTGRPRRASIAALAASAPREQWLDLRSPGTSDLPASVPSIRTASPS